VAAATLSRDKVLVLFPVLTVLRFGAVDERVEGVFPQVDPLFRSLWTVARQQVSSLVFCSVDLGQAVGFVDARWLDLAWLPLGDGGR